LLLICISLVAPIVLLIANLKNYSPLPDFLKVHLDAVLWSLLIAAVTAAIAHILACGPFSLSRHDATGKTTTQHLLAMLMRVTIFLVMLIPASLVAASLLRILSMLNLPSTFRQGWYIVSFGQAVRFAGIALIVFMLMRHTHRKQLSEMASLDGASPMEAWWHVQLPRTWPLLLGSILLITMLSLTELSATMMLLPPGLPNFAQNLLNQMHYAMDQQVITSCLILVCLFLVLAVVIVLLLRLVRLNRRILISLMVISAMCVAGCDEQSQSVSNAKVLSHFGRTGSGQSEFMYPRAIDIAADGSLYVVDKTGRIQHFTQQGDFINVIKIPDIEAGKPTGMTIAPDGNIYVADTHYYRVLIFSQAGEIIGQFGKYGQDDGCFIYPTDVAFSGEGKIFVSEYGGNDRISVFDEKGNFLYCFGTCGDGENQFARPSALCVDLSRQRLYVADACNHRIAIYSFDGSLLGYIGSAGTAAGKLRYPYDLTMLSDGTLVVCEFGNNRVQLFNPDGQSLAVYGGPGRQLGQLAYPWAVWRIPGL
jgi:DNA-binding beta-propeller fold protein YncE/ABC-type spermidine/putrescine transport system permease subunit II